MTGQLGKHEVLTQLGSMVDPDVYQHVHITLLSCFLFQLWLTRSQSSFTSEMWPERCYRRRSAVLVTLSGSPRWGSTLTPRSQMCSNSSQSTWPMHSLTMALNILGCRTSLCKPHWQIVSTSPWPRPWKRGSGDPPLVSALLGLLLLQFCLMLCTNAQKNWRIGLQFMLSISYICLLCVCHTNAFLSILEFLQLVFKSCDLSLERAGLGNLSRH